MKISLVNVAKPVLDIRTWSQSQARIVHYEFSMAAGRASRWKKNEKQKQKVFLLSNVNIIIIIIIIDIIISIVVIDRDDGYF